MGTLDGRNTSEPPPLLAVLGSCDLRCAWCNYKGDSVVACEGEVERIREQLLDLRARGQTRVGFGVRHTEPTRHPDFPEIVRVARGLGFEEITLSTSGLRLADAAYVRELREAGLSCVVLTVVGVDTPLADLLLGRAGAAAAKLAAIANCAAAGLYLFVMTLYMRPALTELPAAIPQLVKLVPEGQGVVHGAVPDSVREAPLTRVAALWPRYDEVAWLMSRPELPRGFGVQSSDMPLCVRRRISGMKGAQMNRTDAGVAFVKPPARCAECADEAACLGVESGYLAAHGDDFTVAGGPREPAPPDLEALRQLLGPIVEVEVGAPLPDDGAGHAVAEEARVEPWQARVAELLEPACEGGVAPLAGYVLRELKLARGQVLLRLESATDVMELYLERKTAAERYFKAGRQLAVSYLPGTPPDNPARLRLVGALLRRLDGRV